jgi:predicted metal-dependent peptidase
VASLALQLDLVAVVDERLPTAATDGRAVYVNPHWLNRQEPEKRLFVLAHEVWHNALLHLRRGQGRDPRRWNLAIDHEVNGMLARDGFRRPADAVHFPGWEDLAAEVVYERLGDERAPRPDRPVDADLHLRDDGEPAAVRDDLEAFGPLRGKHDPDYPGRASPPHADEWAERMVALADQLGGDLPAVLRRAVRSVTRPSLPWRLLLREFLERCTGGSSRWIPPSRRHVHRGLYLPSRGGELLRIAVAVDTSGSTAADLPRFLAALQSIVRSFGRYHLRLLQCDAEVGSDERYDETRPLPADLDVVGGGGTDFRPVFDRLADEPGLFRELVRGRELRD